MNKTSASYALRHSFSFLKQEWVSTIVLCFKVLALSLGIVGLIVGALFAAGVWQNPLMLSWSHLFLIGFVIGQVMKIIATPIITMPVVVAISRSVVLDEQLNRDYFTHFKDMASLKTALVLFLIGLTDMLFNLVNRFAEIDENASLVMIMVQLMMIVAVVPLILYLFGNLTYLIPAMAVGKSLTGMKDLFVPFKGKVWLIIKIFLLYLLVFLGSCVVLGLIAGAFYLMMGNEGWVFFKSSKIAQALIYLLAFCVVVVVMCALEALWWAMIASIYKFSTWELLKEQPVEK